MTIRPLHEKWMDNPEWCVDPMKNTHAKKEDYIQAWKEESFSAFVATKRAKHNKIRRVCIGVGGVLFLIAAYGLILTTRATWF